MLQQDTSASYGDAAALVAGGWAPADGLYSTAAVSPQQEQAVLTAYLPMVKRVVRQLASQAGEVMDQNDMTQVGLMGLLEALRRYGAVDEAFAGYARQRVRGAILDELRRQDWRPRTVRQSAHKARDAVRALRRQLGAEPTPAQIQQALGMDDEAYLAYEQAESAEAMASLDEMVGQGMDLPSSAADPQHAVLHSYE